MPLVASEKNVDACVVSSLFEKRVSRVHRQSLAPAAADFEDQRVVPRVAVAALELDGRERGVDARRAGGDERPAVGGGAGRLRQVDVAAAEQVLAARSGVADRDRRPPPDLLLHVDVVDVHARVLEVELHRPHRDRAGAIERRIRERRIDDDRPRRERRVGHRHDQVLVIVGVEVEPVAAAHRGAAVAERIPREAERAATGSCRSGSRRAGRRPAPTR